MIENTRDGLKSITIMRITSDGKTNISPRTEAFNTFCMKHVIFIYWPYWPSNRILSKCFHLIFLLDFCGGGGSCNLRQLTGKQPTNKQTILDGSLVIKWS